MSDMEYTDVIRAIEVYGQLGAVVSYLTHTTPELAREFVKENLPLSDSLVEADSSEYYSKEFWRNEFSNLLWWGHNVLTDETQWEEGVK